MKKIFFIIALLGLFTYDAFAMSSDNYNIDSDAFNDGGGVSSSTNFGVVDSVAEAFIGESLSDNFGISSGFESELDGGISLLVDSDTKSLGLISAGIPVEATTTLAVDIVSSVGYDLYISENKNLTHTDGTTEIDSLACDIANPCLWDGKGLGFTVLSATAVETKWGSEPDFKFAAIPLSQTVFHSNDSYVSGGDITVVGYKLDVPASQRAGNYSNSVSYTAMVQL